MSRTIRKYLVRDSSNKYKRIEQQKLLDAYYTDVAKSHDRKIKKKGLPEDPADNAAQ
jgi:hypothetical protein